MCARSRSRMVLVDTNVWLNYFLGVEPFCSEATSMLAACIRADGNLLYTPTAAHDIFYLVQRVLRRREREELQSARGKVVPGECHTSDRRVLSVRSYAPAAWGCVERMMEIAHASPLSFAECELARQLRSRHGDFEDNLVIASAETCDVDYIATFDKDLIRHFAPVCVRPREVTRALEVFSGRTRQS